MQQKIFIVQPDKIELFLQLLDDGEVALVSYRGYPLDNYMVEVDTSIWWEEIDNCEGIVPVQ